MTVLDLCRVLAPSQEIMIIKPLSRTDIDELMIYEGPVESAPWTMMDYTIDMIIPWMDDYIKVTLDHLNFEE